MWVIIYFVVSIAAIILSGLILLAGGHRRNIARPDPTDGTKRLLSIAKDFNNFIG